MEQTQQTRQPGLTAPALVNWKNPPKLSELKQDLLDAKPAHDAKVLKIEGWLANLRDGGKAPAGTPKNSSKIAPKLIRKQAEWRYAALSEPFLSSPDVFNVKPVSWEDRGAAKQNQLVLNHQFNTQIDKVAFIDEYVRAAVDEGTVTVRLGWEFSEEDIEGEVLDVRYVTDPSFEPTIAELEQLKAQDPIGYRAQVPEELREAHRLSVEQGAAVRPQIVELKQGKRKRTVCNKPTVEVCDFRNVVLDPTCNGNIDKASFVGYSFESSKAQLRKDGRYKNLEFINAGTAPLLGQPDHVASEGAQSNFNFNDDARKKFVVQEYSGYWDVHGDGNVVPFVAAWVGTVLVRMELSPFPDKKLPFVTVQYLPVRKSTHGEPDGALLEDNQKVIGAVTRGMIDILGKSANGQTGMRKDMLDATNRRKFDAGLDYEFNTGVDPKQGVFMHTYPEIPQSAQFMLQLQGMEAESLTGVKTFQQGISGNSLGEVAAGVRGALDASSKRELGILRRLAEGMVKIGRKIIAMNAEFLSEEEVIRVTNDEFVLVRRDDLAGNFDLQLSISTAEEDNNKVQQLAFIYQTAGPNGDPNLNKMILADICRLQKMPDLAKKIESYQPQPDPLQQQKMMLEMQLLAAQAAKENALAQQALATANLNGAKVNTEGAKAGHLSADTDLKNLNFVEQESGVTQERNKELQGEQARSQGQLKLLDHGFEREKLQADLVKEYVKARLKPKTKPAA